LLGAAFNPLHGRYNHYGDPVCVGDYIYIPVEPSGGTGVGLAVAVYKTNLTFVGWGKFPESSPQISGPNLHGGRGSWLAYNPRDKLFYSSCYHTTWLHRYCIKVGPTPIDPIGNPSVVVTYDSSIQIRGEDGNPVSSFGYIQGGKFSASGKLYLTRWLENGGIFVIDPNTGKFRTKIPVAYNKSEREELEGLDILDARGKGIPSIASQLHVIMIQTEDLSNDDWYFKHFNVPDFDRL
jgi:hypothetical protein